ncbi:Myrosinase 1 [Cryptotermes secundus]|uniref:beta-glucosidase n=1 Tax=Cryptotermes secundus TaxID=105785 RepID=A0A2J7PKK0_9NEOP|nr:myrosinase 1 [Cryptotermes secundus]PNF16839.1 Myrosinase 1 [Cryptotermes secundus]
MSGRTLSFLVLVAAVCGARVPTNSSNYTFPDGFKFGVATASYQVEGAWNKDGKGHSIWDYQTHNETYLIADGSNGDDACDSYHMLEKDVALLKNLGVDFYRFSFSWSRLLPSGHINAVNNAGIDYYNGLIDALLREGIEPLATIYHWDLPQQLQDLGGWPNPVLADYFEDYARLLFENFGDRIKMWITFNEPSVFTNGYESNINHAPSIEAPGFGKYLASHTVLKAHAQAYHLYNNMFRETQKGNVGITLTIDWCEPKEETEHHLAACERFQQFEMGLYGNPIFSEEGDYPEIVKTRVDNISEAQGFRRSRLPKFTQDEIEYIRGTADFFGLNHYTTQLGTPSTVIDSQPSYRNDIGIHTEYDESWPESASSWLRDVPWGFRKILVSLKQRYGNPPIIITENGFSDREGHEDDSRIHYHIGYLTELLKALHEDGVNVFGYTAWSLMDNFEWNQGYTERFGLHYVNFTDPERPRTIKKSGKIFKEIVATREIPERFRK